MTVVTTARTYLFGRCAPPEVRVPANCLNALDGRGGRTVAVGPHGSATPAPTLRKLGVDAVVRGECEEIVAELAANADWSRVRATAVREGDEVRITGGVHASGFVDHPALAWPAAWIAEHPHHHHRFDEVQRGFGAEVEASDRKSTRLN